MERTHATGRIEVDSYEPAPYDKGTDGAPDIVEIHVKEHFTGDITGQGAVRFLQTLFADGSASFVGVERLTGASLGGRTGTFVLQDAGTVAGAVVSGTWFVVPGSATGELAGLRGEGGFRADLGQNAEIWLDYWFES
jgi:Protein of unknown function (DUF3224)